MDTNEMTAAKVTSETESRIKGTGKLLFLIIGLVIGACVTAVFVLKLKGGFRKLEGKGYDTPEEAVLAYAEYLKAGDFDNIVSTFAMESYVDNYSVKEYYDRIRAFSPNVINVGQQYVKLGYDSDLITSINLENRKAYISGNVFRQCIIPMCAKIDDDNLSSTFTKGIPYTIGDEEKLDAVMDFINSSPEFEDMKIGECLDVSKINPDYLKGLKDSVKRKEKEWGGDIEYVCLELKIDGEDYVLCMTCVCYDDRWYNAEFSNYYGMIFAVPTSAGGLAPGNMFEELKK